MGTMAKNILNYVAKFEDLTLLLKDGQKENVRTLATDLQRNAKKLYNLGRKGKATHEAIDTVEINFSSPYTSIGILNR